MKPVLEFLNIFLLGIVIGVSFSHLLQRGPKAEQILLRNYYGRVIGGLEVAAMFSTVPMGIVTWGEAVVPYVATLASGGVRLMVIIWAAD